MGNGADIKTSLDMLAESFFSGDMASAREWAGKVARYGREAAPYVEALKREEPVLSGILDTVLSCIESPGPIAARAKEILLMIREMAYRYRHAQADGARSLEDEISKMGQAAAYAVQEARFSGKYGDILPILDALEGKIRTRMTADAEQRKREEQERLSDKRPEPPCAVTLSRKGRPPVEQRVYLDIRKNDMRYAIGMKSGSFRLAFN